PRGDGSKRVLHPNVPHLANGWVVGFGMLAQPQGPADWDETMRLSPQESREVESELARPLQQAAEREAELRERAGRRDRRERRDLYDPDPREPRVVPRHRGQHRQPPRWGRRREAGQQGAATAGQAGEDASTRWLRRVNVAL